MWLPRHAERCQTLSNYKAFRHIETLFVQGINLYLTGLLLVTQVLFTFRQPIAGLQGTDFSLRLTNSLHFERLYTPDRGRSSEMEHDKSSEWSVMKRGINLLPRSGKYFRNKYLKSADSFFGGKRISNPLRRTK